MKEKLKKQEGITLIALVITIIVLLILAGVTIATLTGDNGILTQAKNAKESSKEAEVQEEISLIASEWAIEKHKGKKTLGEFLNSKVTEGKLDRVIDNGDGTYTIEEEESRGTIKESGEVIYPFSAKEWDKTAASEDCFIWGSNSKGQSGYDTIIGYTSKLEGYTKLRFPSRCKKIKLGNWGDESGNSRSFCSTIKTVELPDTLVEIGNYAFASSDWTTGFDELESIVIPNGVTYIGNNAFMLCKKINSITIPSSVTTIVSGAFS